jgi:hypothetical protein
MYKSKPMDPVLIQPNSVKFVTFCFFNHFSIIPNILQLFRSVSHNQSALNVLCVVIQLGTTTTICETYV